MKKTAAIISALILLAGCGRDRASAPAESALFRIDNAGDSVKIITFAPDGASWDSTTVSGSISRMICMSSSYIAYLSAIGCDSVICGVSGAKYISDTVMRRMIANGAVSDVGSDTTPDYEKILALTPDMVVTYSMPGSDFVPNLRSLGVPVLVLNDYLASSPLGRASYIKVFGALTGKGAKADSVFTAVSARYEALVGKVNADERVNVLMNIPYADSWYIPGGSNYMTRLVHDAGGDVLGAVPGKSESSVISLEKAYILAKDADFWINTGWCDTREQLYGSNAMFSSFGIGKIYNNTLRVTPEGGNDFWESGAVRPDLILHDLISILHPDKVYGDCEGLHYYKEVQ